MSNKLFGGFFIGVGAAVLWKFVAMHHEYFEYVKFVLAVYPGWSKFATNLGWCIGLTISCIIGGIILIILGKEAKTEKKSEYSAKEE